MEFGGWFMGNFPNELMGLPRTRDETGSKIAQCENFPRAIHGFHPISVWWGDPPHDYILY